jgi:cholesterol transport system auxiliary component
MKNNCFMLVVLCCLLAGCMGKNVPPADTYTISPDWEKSSNQGRMKMKEKNRPIIKLAPIRATRAFTGTDIVYSNIRNDQDSYAYSRWNDAPVKLLPMVFQIALEKSGRFGAVLPATSASKADVLIESTLYDFSHHINADGTSDGVIRIRIYLIKIATKEVIATREFFSRVPASSRNAQGAATALNKAATYVARDLTAWLAEPGKITP